MTRPRPPQVRLSSNELRMMIRETAGGRADGDGAGVDQATFFALMSNSSWY